MRVAITAAGSRGDIQPYVALGAGLRAAGHEVRITGPEILRDLATSYGLEFHPVPLDPRQGVEDQLTSRGANLVQFTWRSYGILRPVIDESLERFVEACTGADLVVYTSVGFFGYAIAEELDLPRVGAFYGPLVLPTRYYPTSFLPVPSQRVWSAYERPLGLRQTLEARLAGNYNRLSYYLTVHAMWQTLRLVANPALRRQGMKRFPLLGPFGEIAEQQQPVLNGWSPSVLPYPPDWNRNWPVTGYWFLDEGSDWEPPAELTDFLESGDKPVAIGFGSMSSTYSQELTEIVLEALEICGLRAVLLSGWGNLGRGDLPDHVLRVDEAPHDWLYPRVAACVHHGGSGSTAASLRAGVPTVIVPHFADQFFWGSRVHNLGVGPKAVPRSRLTAENLAAALQAATANTNLKNRAATLGRRISSEDGVGVAVEELQRMVG